MSYTNVCYLYSNGDICNALSDIFLQIKGRLSILRSWHSYGAESGIQAFAVFPCIKKSVICSCLVRGQR